MQNRIISLSEKGLNLDTMHSEQYISAKQYVYANDYVLYTTTDSVIHLNLSNTNFLKKYDIQDIKNIKMCNCGLHIFVLTYQKKLILLKDKVNDNFDAVEKAMISCNYLAFIKSSELFLTGLFEYKNADVKDFILLHDYLILITRKKAQEKQFLIIVDTKEKKIFKNEFDNIEKFEAKINSEKNYILISLTTEYSKNSYFGTIDLFLYNILKCEIKKINIEHPLLYYEFTNNGFIVCYGPQPSLINVFDFYGNSKKKLESGIRNRFYFNNHQNLVCFAGFGNLAGNIEIFSNKFLCKMKVLGASIFNWSPCGSYFLIAITNELKVDNKILVYDYFGRLIKEIKYDNLESVVWVGQKEDFKVLNEPEILNIKKEGVYVPPHLRKENNETKKNYDKKTNLKNKINVKNHSEKKGIKNTDSKIENKYKKIYLENELKEIAIIKEKLKNGDCLNVEEMNKILMEDEIKEKLKSN